MSERTEIVKKIKERFPQLEKCILEKKNPNSAKYPPNPMQLKPKTFEMLLEIINKSEALWDWGMTDVVSETLLAYGPIKTKCIYFGFIQNNETDKQLLWINETAAYVSFNGYKLPLEESVILFCILLALENDPLQIGPRLLSRHCKAWLSRYIVFLANRLDYVMN